MPAPRWVVLFFILLLPWPAWAQGRTAAVLPPLLRGEANPTPEAQFSDAVVGALRNSGGFERIIEPDGVRAALGEAASKGLVQCANDECSVVDADLLGGIDATHVVVSSTSVIGSSVLVKMKLIEVRRALEVGTSVRRVPANQLDTLAATLAAMTEELLVQAGMKEPAPPPAPVAAAAPVAEAPVKETTSTAPAAEEPAGPSPIVPVLVVGGVVAVAGVALLLVGAAAGLGVGIAFALQSR